MKCNSYNNNLKVQFVNYARSDTILNIAINNYSHGFLKFHQQ